MMTAVGAFVVYDHLADFKFRDWRSDIGLAAASSGSVYLIAWAQRHGNRRHRTVSIIAAIVGLVPDLCGDRAPQSCSEGLSRDPRPQFGKARNLTLYSAPKE